MVKRISLILLLCIIVIVICSCDSDFMGKNYDTYPQLEIAPTCWRADCIYLPLRPNHQFIINHLYDEVETDQGYDIVVHIRRESND